MLNLTDVIERQRLSRFQLTIIALCVLVAVLDGFDTQCIGLLAPAIAQSLNLDLHAFGPVFGAGLFGLMLALLDHVRDIPGAPAPERLRRPLVSDGAPPP